jgi:hypothetical protein
VLVAGACRQLLRASEDLKRPDYTYPDTTIALTGLCDGRPCIQLKISGTGECAFEKLVVKRLHAHLCRFERDIDDKGDRVAEVNRPQSGLCYACAYAYILILKYDRQIR